ncbi:hypothetical protein BGZ89_006039 [Linnemannia elongata]|nr:hypothetical protein BGZ89_006039 [Linnemannia elongata]
MSQGNASQHVQAVRSVYKDGFSPSSSSTSRDGGVVLLTCHFDPSTRLEFVLWEDILAVFRDGLYVRYEGRVLPFMKDTKFRTLDPQKDCCNPERDAGDSHRRSSDTRRQEFPKAIQNRSPEYLSGDYVAFRMYYHALLPSDANYVPPTTPAQRDVNKATHTLSRTHLESDDEDAAVWHMTSASRGYAPAQYSLAVMYDEGRGLPQSDTEAKRWYVLAAEQDHPKTAFNLGLFYENGQGFMKAAELGHAGAIYNVGVVFDQGKGVKQDLGKTFEWYVRAAEKGHASAEHNLGFIYENGEAPGGQDNIKSRGYYLRAARRGHAKTQFSVGLLYDTGKGFDQDSRKALRFYLKSAEQDHAPAQFNVGFVYEHCEGWSGI